MTELETIDEALAYVTSLGANDRTHHVYRSIVAQLKYVRGVVDGSEADTSRLGDITLGVLGVREFDAMPDIADRLVAVAAIADRRYSRG